MGAGPVGLACGIEAQREGLSVKLIDKGALVNSLTGYPFNMEFFSTAELLEIGNYPFPTRGAKPSREEALSYYQKVADTENLDIHLYERVLDVTGSDEGFTVETDRASYPCRKVVLVTGFFDIPNSLNVPGESLPKVTHYFTEPYRYARQEVVVIGAKNSAAKAALQCHRAGARVTMVVRGPEIAESVKYWIRPDLINRIEEGGIKAYFNTTVRSIEPDTITLSTPEGEKVIVNSWVLALTGYQPDYSFMRQIGITIDSDEHETPIHDPNTFETERKGLFMAGTVCGRAQNKPVVHRKWALPCKTYHAIHCTRCCRGRDIYPRPCRRKRDTLRPAFIRLQAWNHKLTTFTPLTPSSASIFWMTSGLMASSMLSAVSATPPLPPFRPS